MVTLIAPLSDRLIRGQYPIHRPAPSTSTGLRRAASPTTSAGARSTKRGQASTSRTCSRSDSHSARAGRLGRGLLVPGSRPLTTVEGCPRHPQRLARRRHADLHCKRLGCHQQRVPCSRFNPSSPGYFSLYVQDRVRGVQLVLQASHFRLERAHLRIQRVAFARLCAALLRGQLPKRTLAPRLAPSRQMGAVQPLAAKQSTHLTGLRTALRLLKDPQPILRGELAPRRFGHDLRVRGRSCAPGPGGLVATLLDPQGRNGTLIQCHRVSLCGHRCSPPPPYSNSKGCWCLSHVGREGRPIPVHPSPQDSVGRERYRYCGVDHRGDAGTASRPTGVQLRPWVPQPREPGAARRNARPQCAAAQGSAFQWAEREREEAQAFAEARRQHPAVESAINNLEHRGLDRVALPRRRWVCAHRCIVDTGPPTCTASVCLCDGACVRPNDVEDAALPERRPSPAGFARPARRTETGAAFGAQKSGMRAGFDAKRRSVVPVRWVPWPRPRRKCAGSSQISCRSGGFLPDH